MNDQPHSQPQPWLASLCLVVLTLGSCQPSSGGERDRAYRSLGVVGYNHTDQVIDDFDVDGVGGDLLGISNSRSGGGETLCCISWRDGTKLPMSYHVRWVADVCEFRTPPNMYGETFESTHQFYKEVDVDLQGPIPTAPAHLGMHFYPDGHIEVALTAEASSEPRLKLDPNRRRQGKRCSADDLKN